MKLKIIVLALTLLLPLILAVWNRKSCGSQEKRYRQVLMPWAALVYMIACCVLFEKLEMFVAWLLDRPYLASVKTWITTGSGLSFGLILYSVYLLNIAVLLGYVVLKNSSRGFAWLFDKLFALIMKLLGKGREKEEKIGDIPADYENLKGPKRLYWGYINIFYTIEEGSGKVRSRYVTIGHVFRYAANIIIGLYLLALLFFQLPLMLGLPVSWIRVMNNIIGDLYLWPPISLILLKEIAYYLGGKQEEYVPLEDKIICSEPETKHEADYAKLTEHYHQQFPERYLDSFHAPNYPVSLRPVEPENDLAKAILERLQAEKKEANHEISEAVIQCITDLPARHNAVIDSVLSAEFGYALLLYLNVLLSRGENVLVLCEDESTCDEIRDYIIAKLTQINLFAPVWIVRSVKDAYRSGDCDVLVLTPQVVLDDKVTSAQKRFFDHLTTVMMVNTSRIVAEMGNLLTVVSNSLAQERNPLQYICLCNGIPGELRITLERLISPGREFKPYECFRSDESTQLVLWNYEGRSKDEKVQAQNNLFGTAMDHVYLGVLLPLACVGVKYGVNQLSIMGKNIPAQQLVNALTADFSQMQRYFDAELLATDLTEKLHFNHIGADNPFIIALDETYNLPMTMRNFCRHIGNQTSMVHIVSKPYMLRDYFAAHAEGYLIDRKKAEMFSPFLSDSRKVLAIKLISEAATASGLAEERLLFHMRSLVQQTLQLYDALKLCLQIASNGDGDYNIENEFAVSTVCTFDEGKNEYVYRRVVHLKEKQLLDRLIGDIHPAKVHVDAEEISLSIGRKDVYRYYLPDQAMVVGNHMYYIASIDAQQGIVFTDRKIENLDLPLDYYQHRTYDLQFSASRTEHEVSVDMRSSKVKEYAALKYSAALYHNVKMQVDTLGYFAPHPSAPRLDLTDKTCYRSVSAATRNDARRKKENTSVLSLRFDGIAKGMADKVSFTLAALLSELMKTYFPYNWPCIAVVPVLHSEKFFDDGSMMSENLSAVYPQVRVEGKLENSADTAEVLIIEDSESDTGILDTLYRNRQTPMRTTFSLLLDFIKWHNSYEATGNILGDYLCFGGDKVPDEFNLPYVQQMLQQMEVVNPSGIVWVSNAADSDYCYFCGKGLHLSEYVEILGDDGKRDRKVCVPCSKRLLHKRKDLAPLYQRTRKYLHDEFGVTLSKRLKIKFVSASTISKQFKKNKVKGRVIGLAQKLTRTVWVETMSPEEHILSTLVHELTHFWQFDHIKMDDTVAVEGHASYVEVQFMKAEGFKRRAAILHEGLMSRTDDEYGQGYAKLVEIMKKRPDDNTFTYMLETYGKKQNAAPGAGGTKPPAPAAPQDPQPIKPPPGGPVEIIQSTGVEIGEESVDGV